MSITGSDRPDRAASNAAPLDAINFLLADVKDGLGPFLAIFLMSSQHWDAGRIGLILTIGGLATVVVRTPGGALVDRIRWPRTLIAVAAFVVAAASAAMALAPRFGLVAAAQTMTGAADALLPPAVAAISLGIVGRRRFSARIGRNEAFNHGGNVITAVLAGLAGRYIDPSAVLWIVAGFALCSIVAAYRIDGRAIDHDLARGCESEDRADGSGLIRLWRNRPFVRFTLAITLFHFANAAMLPLLGEQLSLTDQKSSSLFMAACIVTAQIAMVPMAILVGRTADRWGRKPLFLIGFAVLPVRGVLYTLTHDTGLLIAIQLLDGVGAGLFGALFFIVVADLSRGDGAYSLAQGAASASWGLGAALSNAAAGLVANLMGYAAAFLALAAIAAAALIVFWLGVPETLDFVPTDRRERVRASLPATDRA